jgi:glycosyltransferase involved in cell wall biosynthesis
MRILLLFPMADGQTGPGIKYSFEELGHTVKDVDAKLRPQESFSVACEFRPDLIFCSRTEALAEQVAKIKQKMKVIACVWNVDTRTTINKWRHLFPLIKICDYYFVVASRLIPEWRKFNKNTFWLPEGFLPAYGKPKSITDEDKEKYSCDVCWIGSRHKLHKWRNAYLSAVEQMGIDFKQWGCARQPDTYDEAHNKAIFLSKIGLAASGWPENEKYTSSRDYKILAAGGFLLEYYRDRIDEVFPSDIMDYYTSPENLVEKIRYWLENEEKRKEFAERGYKWVRENATFACRMKMVLDYIGMK